MSGDAVAGCVLAIVLIAFAWGASFSVESDKWKTDCERLGVHMTQDKIYTCSLKQKIGQP